MRDFWCRNCFKKSKQEYDSQIYCKRSPCIKLEEKDRDRKATRRTFHKSGTARNNSTVMDAIA